MNIFDIGIILLLIMFIIVGFKNGVIKELFSLVGIIIVFYLAFLLMGYLGNIFCLVFPFFDFYGTLKGITALNLLLYQAIAFILIFGILLSLYALVLKISKVLQKIVNMTIILWLPSKILGALVGLCSGIIFLYVIFVILIIPIGNYSIYTDSVLVDKIVYNTPVISKSTEKFTKTSFEIANLKNRVVNKEISVNDTNLKTIEIMLDNNITNRKTIERLIKLNKLKNVNNINSVLNNY